MLVVLIGGGANYTLTDSSTSFCILDDVMYQFYLFVFPNIVMLSIGGVILVVTLQVVNKVIGIMCMLIFLPPLYPLSLSSLSLSPPSSIMVYSVKS